MLPKINGHGKGLREAPDENGDAALLVKDPSLGLTPELAARIRAHPILGAKLLIGRRHGVVFVVTPADRSDRSSGRAASRPRSRRRPPEILGDTGLNVTVTGFPTIRVAIVDVLKRDQIVLNGVGAVIGFVMSLIAFRSLAAAVVTAIPAIVAGLVVLGGMGLFGVPVTVMSNVVPALVMILGYADGMHLSHAWRHHRDQGTSPLEAEWLAQKEVGAACMLTALTVAGAFLSLAITDIAIVRNFAFIGAVAMIIGCAMVLIGHALGAIAARPLLENAARTGANPSDAGSKGHAPSLGRFVVDHARPIGADLGAPLRRARRHVPGRAAGAFDPRAPAGRTTPPMPPSAASTGNFGGAFPVEIVVPLTGLDATSSGESVRKIGASIEAVAARRRRRHAAVAVEPGRMARRR